MVHTLTNLDSGQLGIMWQFLQLGKQQPSSADVRLMIKSTDKIRQALVQMTGGNRKEDPAEYLDYFSGDYETYKNFIVLSALAMRVSGVLDRILQILEAEEADKVTQEEIE